MTVTSCCRLLAPILLVVAAASAHAETKTKPQIAISTKAVEATVTVDPALRKYPGLFEDNLAEGRRWAERNRAEAAKARRDEPEFFREGRRWSFERSYNLRSEVGRYISVLRDDGTYTGGAHPNSYMNTILWDRDARRRVNIRPLFRETADNGPTMTALAQLARVAVRGRKAQARHDQRRRAEGEADAGEPRQARPVHLRWRRAIAAQDRSDLAGAVDGIRQELGAYVPLFAVCGRRLCRRSLHRVRAVDGVPVAPLAARHRDLRRPASRKRQY